MHAMQSLMIWRWSSWVFCAPGASLIWGEVKVNLDTVHYIGNQWITVPNVPICVSMEIQFLKLFMISNESPYYLQCSRSLSNAAIRTLNRLSRRKCQEMWKMPFMQSVMREFYLKFNCIKRHNISSVTPPKPFLALSFPCSSQCKEPTGLFCRTFVQSHEGIYAVFWTWQFYVV